MKLQHVNVKQSDIFMKLEVLPTTQVRKRDEKASELDQEVNRLQIEVKAREQQVKKMSASMKSCSKRLNSLASTSETVTKGTNLALSLGVDPPS